MDAVAGQSESKRRDKSMTHAHSHCKHLQRSQAAQPPREHGRHEWQYPSFAMLAWNASALALPAPPEPRASRPGIPGNRHWPSPPATPTHPATCLVRPTNRSAVHLGFPRRAGLTLDGLVRSERGVPAALSIRWQSWAPYLTHNLRRALSRRSTSVWSKATPARREPGLGGAVARTQST